MNSYNASVFFTIENVLREHRKLLKKYIHNIAPNLTVDQFSILFQLYKHPGVTQHELGNLSNKENASISRMVELLVEKKIIARIENLNDRRRNNLYFTSKGKLIMEKIVTSSQICSRKALEGIEMAELEIFLNILDKIDDNCKK